MEDIKLPCASIEDLLIIYFMSLGTWVTHCECMRVVEWNGPQVLCPQR